MIMPFCSFHLTFEQTFLMTKKSFSRLLLLVSILLVSNCAGGITSAQKRESTSYKAKGLYIEEKKVGLATGLGILPGGGSFYTREYGIGVVNLILWPFSILWDPLSGQRAAERINYYATKEHVESLKKEELNELMDLMMQEKINTKIYLIKKRQIEDRYSVN